MTRMNTITRCAIAVLFAASLMSPMAQAKPGPGGQDSGRRGPPEEAFEACADKAEGDSCGFSGPRGDVEGSCVLPRSDDQTLVCAPADRGGRPPQDEYSQ